jgi:hypothetical protein
MVGCWFIQGGMHFRGPHRISSHTAWVWHLLFGVCRTLECRCTAVIHLEPKIHRNLRWIRVLTLQCTVAARSYACRLPPIGPGSACSLSASQRTSLCYLMLLKCLAYPSNSLAIGQLGLAGNASELSAAPPRAASLATATESEIIRATHPGEPGSLEVVPACNTAQAWRQPWGMLKT